MAHLATIRNEQHAKALLARDRFLERHPELRGLQRRIDDKLRKAGSDHNRLVLIHTWMMDSFFELFSKLQPLVSRMN
jgi:hypothetical protein